MEPRTRGLAALAATASLLAAPAAASAAEDPYDAALRRAWTTAGTKLARAHSVLPAGAYPHLTASSGAWTTTNARSWTSGFFPGAHWLRYQETADTAVRSRALSRQAGVEGQKYDTTSHDVGFQMLTTLVNSHRLTGNRTHRDVALRGAQSLATRWNPTVGALRSWNHGSGPTDSG